MISTNMMLLKPSARIRTIQTDITGLTGLPVARNPPYILVIVYNKILRTLEKMPPDTAYRRYTEEIVKNRLELVKASKSVDELETKINCGQAEELIQQAEQELELARKFLVWKPWEPLVTKPPANQWTWPPTK